MTKTVLAALAAAIVAGTAFTSAAEAGGVRVGFGFPLGSFVAREHSPGASYGGYGNRRYRDPRICAPVRKALKKKHNPATNVAAARKPSPKVEKVAVAKVETKSSVAEAPVINIPGTPVAETSTDKPVETAAIQPEPVTEVIKAEEPETEQATQAAADTHEVGVTEKAKQACRKFSALIGDLIDVPCK